MSKKKEQKQQSFFQKYTFHFLLALILLIAAFLRFYDYPFRYSLGEETVRDAVIGIEGARELQAPLTGAFSSLGPFTFGPWYGYQMIIATLILHTTYAPWIYLTLISILTVFVAYKIGELLVDKWFGLLLALLVTFSPAQVISATHLTSHNMTNIFAVTAFYLFLRILKKDISYWYGFFLGVTLGIGINLHYQMAGLLVLPLIILFVKPKRFLYFVTAASGVFFTFLPLIFFELNNHWFNTKNLFEYFFLGKNRIVVPYRWLFYVRDFWPAFWADTFGITTPFAYLILIGVIGYFSFLAITKKLSRYFVCLIIAFFVNFLLLRYYWGPRFFGYLNFMRPYVFIFTGYTIYSLKNIKFGKTVAVLAVIFLIWLGFPSVKDELTTDPFTQNVSANVTALKNLYPHQTFAFYSCTRSYKGGINAEPFTDVFFLDRQKMISPKGMAIALPNNKDCSDNQYTQIGTTGFIYLGKKTAEDLKKEGFEPLTFASIYTLNARWWFQLQP